MSEPGKRFREPRQAQLSGELCGRPRKRPAVGDLATHWTKLGVECEQNNGAETRPSAARRQEALTGGLPSSNVQDGQEIVILNTDRGEVDREFVPIRR